ncbi:superinfection immunity protein [Bordetella petrii]|uniref:superinfection immunity protein n=1 Tax=Bordetella petrii TaxID=94624 RepID=UPI001E404E03|nr:superinfection immunity protein [Bordetella petrii]
MIDRQAAARHGLGTAPAANAQRRSAPSGWMTFLRLVVLVILAGYSWAMGQTPPSGLNAFGKLVAGSFFVALPLLYFLPTIEAKLRDQPNIVSIALVNLLLGWTLVGWVVAMAWACTVRKPSAVAIRPEPVGQHKPEAWPSPVNNASVSVADEIRKLADLKAQGLLSEGEFAAQKAKVLAR